MNQQFLVSPAQLQGMDIMGKESQLLMYPPEIRFEEGPWSWKIPKLPSIEITPMIAESRKHRICLTNPKGKFEVYEHVGAARFSGILAVCLECKHSRPPYYGRALEILHTLKMNSCTSKDPMKWYTLKQAVGWVYPDKRNGKVAATRIFPTNLEQTILHIKCSFSDLGNIERTYRLPDDDLLEKICTAHAPGRPAWLYHPSQFAHNLRLGWKHHNHIAWGREQRNEEVLEGIALHRAQDLLGALSFLCQDGLFAGEIYSDYSGHFADMEAVNLAYGMLKRLRKEEV